jgi:hypothetical protein
MRAIAAITLMGLLAQGCIIYEEDYHTDKRGDDVDGTIVDPTTDPWGTDPGTEPTDPEPTLTSDLFLTVDAALPGDTLLSTLEATVDDFDLTQVTTVEFGRDIQVLDMIARDNEVVLLLQVDGEAVPGLVDVFVQTAPGGAWLLESPFTILDPADPGTDPGTGGTDPGTGGTDPGTGGTDTGTGGTDPGTGGTDTGCECTCP